MVLVHYGDCLIINRHNRKPMKNSYELKLTTILEMEVSQLRERLYKVKTENIQLMMEIENLKKKLNEKKP